MSEVICQHGKCYERGTLRSRMDYVFMPRDLAGDIEKDLLDDNLW